jgi:hypothetical protein
MKTNLMFLLVTVCAFFIVAIHCSQNKKYIPTKCDNAIIKLGELERILEMPRVNFFNAQQTLIEKFDDIETYPDLKQIRDFPVYREFKRLNDFLKIETSNQFDLSDLKRVEQNAHNFLLNISTGLFKKLIGKIKTSEFVNDLNNFKKALKEFSDKINEYENAQKQQEEICEQKE